MTKPKVMTDKERLRILTFCDGVLDRLRITKWTVYLHDDVADDHLMGSTERFDGNQVKLQLSSDWVGYPKHTKVDVLIHEMVHASFFDVEQRLSRFLYHTDFFPKSLRQLWTATTIDEFEDLTATYERVLRAGFDWQWPKEGSGVLMRQGASCLRRLK